MLLDSIKAKLVAAGVINTGWTCYIGFCPDTVDEVISLHQTGGYPDDTQAGTNSKATFQLRVRTGRADYAACESKWWEAYCALHNADLSAYNIRLIHAEATAPLEYYDAKERPNMTVNFVVVRDTPTS